MKWLRLFVNETPVDYFVNETMQSDIHFTGNFQMI